MEMYVSVQSLSRPDVAEHDAIYSGSGSFPALRSDVRRARLRGGVGRTYADRLGKSCRGAATAL